MNMFIYKLMKNLKVVKIVIFQLMKKIDGARMMMVGLTNAGYLSEESFKTFGETVNSQFDRLIEKGLSADEAMLLMIPSLIALQDAAALYGFEISDNTRKILEQAKERGLMGDKAKSVDDRMLEAQYVMIDALGIMVELFGGQIPESMRVMRGESSLTSEALKSDFIDAADQIQDQFDDLNLPDFDDINLRVNFDANQFDARDFMGSGFDFDSYQHGGVITKPTLAMTGEGGQPELIGPVGFMSKALEGAISRTGPSEVEREMLSELHGLRSDLKTLPIHLRDALILAG